MATLAAGSTLNRGRYRIKKLLGEGGMGAVYLAEDTHFRKLVAIKENLDSTAEAKQQFELEARILADLKHDALPRVFDCFEEQSGKQYLAMDYIEGDDLEEVLDRQGPLPERQVVQWMVRICDALEYMHSQKPHPVIHRDIKPANLKITPDGSVMLVDFGIAKVHRAGQKTVRAARGATPGYSPPEQYGAGTDARSDIYALGATLYHLLTGVLPPESITLSQAGELPPPRSLNAALSPAVERVILRAMALDPDDRYQSAREMAGDLIALARPVPVAATPPPPASAAAPAHVTCPRCGGNNRPGARFCQRCRAPLDVQPAPAQVACPRCGALNRAGGRFCRQCGGPLALAVAAASSSSPAVCPSCKAPIAAGGTVCTACGFVIHPPARQAEHEIAAWVLLGLGALGAPLAIWWPGHRLLGPWWGSVHFLVALFSLLAARDLLNLGARYASRVSGPATLLFGDRRRGRRWGVIAAAITMIIGVGQAWLIAPLFLAIVAAYVVWILMSQSSLAACRERYTRPPAVTLIGWGLIASGVGVPLGVALLLSKPWARAGAIVGLAAAATFGALLDVVAILWGFIPPPFSTPLAHEAPLYLIGRIVVRPYALTLACYGLTLVAGGLVGIRYLRTPGLSLASTPTSVDQELKLMGWVLIGVGVLELGGVFWLWPLCTWGLLARAAVCLLALACLVAGRDLTQFLQNWRNQLPDKAQALWGTQSRGRRFGAVAAALSTFLFLGLAWLVVPLALALLTGYVVKTLLAPATAALVGARVSAPLPLTLIAWSLIATGIGALPGIGLLRRERWARSAAIGVLAVLFVGGLFLIGVSVYAGGYPPSSAWPLSQRVDLPLIQVPAPVTALTVGSYGAAISVGCLVAIRYLRSAAANSFFII